MKYMTLLAMALLVQVFRLARDKARVHPGRLALVWILGVATFGFWIVGACVLKAHGVAAA